MTLKKGTSTGNGDADLQRQEGGGEIGKEEEKREVKIYLPCSHCQLASPGLVCSSVSQREKNEGGEKTGQAGRRGEKTREDIRFVAEHKNYSSELFTFAVCSNAVVYEPFQYYLCS